jgi:hypothetical protein
MTFEEAFEAYYAKFGADAAPAITWFPGLPEDTQRDIFLEAINRNTPVRGKWAEEISRRLYPEFWEDTTGHVVI